MAEEEKLNESLRIEIEAFQHLEMVMNEQKKRERGTSELPEQFNATSNITPVLSEVLFDLYLLNFTFIYLNN